MFLEHGAGEGATDAADVEVFCSDGAGFFDVAAGSPDDVAAAGEVHDGSDADEPVVVVCGGELKVGVYGVDYLGAEYVAKVIDAFADSDFAYQKQVGEGVSGVPVGYWDTGYAQNRH